MAILTWSLLNLIAWTFGLKAAHDLRHEFEANAKTWVFLTWAVWTCLLMELAMVGAPHFAGLAVVLAALAMLVYIWWRFEWNFAIGAIATLVLDTTKMVGFFALFGLDFNLTAIAALLTIIGYSVNDKVVVYDRMRENLRLYKKMPLREIIDMRINQVFARCIYTSVAILLSMLPMAIWGGSAVENFAVPMVFGVFIATTSSIFIAAPILLLLGDWWQHRSAGREPSTGAVTTKA